MKKFILISLTLVIFNNSFSQTQKGSWLLGGSFSYSTISQTENGNKGNANMFTMNPKIGYFAVSNLAIMLNADYASVSSGNFSDHTLTIGPAARYYFSGSESVKFFLGAGVGFSSSSDTHGTAYQFEGGPAFFISRTVALELSLNYQTASSKNGSEQYSYTTDISQFGVGLGFMIYLGKGRRN